MVAIMGFLMALLMDAKGRGTSRLLAGALVLALFLPVPARAAEPFRLLLLGDSLTAGHGLPRKDAFPARLSATLAARGHAVTVINGGVSGDTTAGGRARLAWLLAEKPQGVIVALGGNDGLRGLDPAVTRGNLDAIVARFKAAGVRVLLAGMRAPPNLGREYGAEFDAIFPALAEAHGVALYPFFLEGVAALPHLNQADGIHPNADGVKAIVGRLLPYAAALISTDK